MRGTRRPVPSCTSPTRSRPRGTSSRRRVSATGSSRSTAHRWSSVARRSTPRRRTASGLPDPISTYAAGHDRRNLPDPDELERNCADQACVLAAAGADLIALEMMADADTCVAMMRGAAEAGLPVSLGLICIRDESGRVMLFGRGRDNLYAGEDAPLDEVLPSIVERMPAGLRLIVAVMHSTPRGHRSRDSGRPFLLGRRYRRVSEHRRLRFGRLGLDGCADAGGVCRQLRAVGGPGRPDRRRVLRIRPRAHPRDVDPPCRTAIRRAVVRGDATTAPDTAAAVRRPRVEPCRGNSGVRSVQTNDE